MNKNLTKHEFYILVVKLALRKLFVFFFVSFQRSNDQAMTFTSFYRCFQLMFVLQLFKSDNTFLVNNLYLPVILYVDFSSSFYYESNKEKNKCDISQFTNNLFNFQTIQIYTMHVSLNGKLVTKKLKLLVFTSKTRLILRTLIEWSNL